MNDGLLVIRKGVSIKVRLFTTTSYHFQFTLTNWTKHASIHAWDQLTTNDIHEWCAVFFMKLFVHEYIFPHEDRWFHPPARWHLVGLVSSSLLSIEWIYYSLKTMGRDTYALCICSLFLCIWFERRNRRNKCFLWTRSC